MARSRRGSFGLQPRVAPNVTGQIVALSREYVAKRDALIMDAWRNGGTFEGKKATDDMVLAYWKERQAGLDEGDPNYENAKNQVMQLTYAVEQSKQDVLHLQGKISDTQYAQFYLKWANKVPKDSEFYRTLQKDAAQLIESSKDKARANGERAKTEAFNKFVQTTTDRDIAIGTAMTKDLDKLSKKTGLSVTGNGDELLALLTQDVKANPNAHRALLDTIHKADPNWNGQLTEGYFSQHIKAAVKGYDAIADRAQKEGFVSAYANATEGMSAMSNWGQNIKVWPVAQTYSDLETAFLKVWNDPNASQMDKMSAANAFSGQLSKLAQSPGIDAGSKTMIEADAQRLLGQDAGDNPSFGTAMLGREGVDPKTAMQLGAWVKTDAEMKANPTAWAYGPVDANGQYDPTGKGPLGMVPAGSVPPGAQGVMVPGADGKAVLAMVVPHAVYSTDPNNPSGSPKLAGYQIAYNVGGKTVEMWGYKGNDGQPRWSLTSPLVEGATTQTDNNGNVFVTPPAAAAVNPAQAAASLKYTKPDGTVVDLSAQGKQLADQLAAGSTNPSLTQNTLDDKGHVTGSIKLSYENGQFTLSQTTNTLDDKGNVLGSQTTPIEMATSTPQQNAFSPSRMAAGDVAGVTFTSALEASVKASSYTQTQDQVSKFASDPAFQQAFLSQTMQTLGTQNPYDPRIAAAWKNVTTATTRPAGQIDEITRNPAVAANRTDLQYPGSAPNPAAYDKALSINFGGGQELRIPGVPSYLKNSSIDLSGAKGAYDTINNIFGNILPGLGTPPQTPQGSPTPTATPGPTATPTASGTTPSNLPTPAPSPTPAPTSPAPTPAPTPNNHPSDYWHGQ